MLGEPIVTVVGNVGGDVELRFTPSGAAVANFSVAVQGRKRDGDSWNDDGEPSWYRVSAWRDLGENCAETVERGMRVVVTGSLRIRKYEAKDGTTQTSVDLTADEVAPSLKWATAKVAKVGRDNGGGGSAADPWATTSTSTSSVGGWNTPGVDSEPPF